MTTTAAPATAPQAPALARSIGPVQMTLYGLGSMLGAGIYGLIGQAAGAVGNAVWLAFLVAMVAALLTALSYASLGSRYPRAGGAAYVTQRAYGMPLLSFVVGMTLVCSGLTSVATQSRVFAANLQTLAGLDALPTWTLAPRHPAPPRRPRLPRHPRIHVGERALHLRGGRGAPHRHRGGHPLLGQRRSP
jgi:amino acid transporter